MWRERTAEEQKLFLSFMQRCGICFERRGAAAGVEAEYIAPDLLPDRRHPAIADELAQRWDAVAPTETATLTYELLPPGLMRALMCSIGQRAGLAGIYWHDGFYVWDRGTGARALIEQRHPKEGWSSEIVISTQKGDAAALRDTLLRLSDNDRTGLGARPSGRTIPGRPVEERATRSDERGGAPPTIAPGHEPRSDEECFVSYAWGDSTPEGRERKRIVDDLCTAAAKAKITIVRDQHTTQYGDRISAFMDRLTQGKRVYVVLSDKYLRSPYCMHELFGVWRNARSKDDEFIARTRVFVHAPARIDTPMQRAEYADHWKRTYDATEQLIREKGSHVLSDADMRGHRLSGQYYIDVANILHTIQDTLAPRSFDEFVQYGFGVAAAARG